MIYESIFLLKLIDRPNSSQIEEDGISFFKIFGEEKILKLTGCFIALRRKKALQLSHAIAPKLCPVAGDPQTTQVNVP